MLRTILVVQTAALSFTTDLRRRLEDRRRRSRITADAGQATAEYALVLLGVAAVALLLLAWATKSGKLAELFDAVVDNLIGKAR